MVTSKEDNVFKKLIITLLILAVVILSCSDDNLVGQSRDVAAPRAVYDLAVGNATDVSLTISWTAPGDDGSTGTATQYDIRFAKDSITMESWAIAFQAGNEPTPQAAGTAESLVISGLNGGTQYYFAMRTADDVPNWSTLSNIASGMTSSDSVAPARITDLAVIDSMISSVILSWTAPGDDSTEGTAASYDIRYDTIFITDSTFDSAFQCIGEPTPRVAGSIDSFAVTGLASDQQYFFAIKAIDEASNLSDSSNVDSTTTRALSAVTDLAISDSTTTSISLTWSSPGDDGINSTPISYDLRYYTDSIADTNWSSATEVIGVPIPDISGTGESFTITGLEYYTEYFFAIRGVDAQGNLAPISNLVVDKTVWSRFAFPYSVEVEDGPLGLVAADFDDDGGIDIIVACSKADSITVLKNNNDSTFSNEGRYITADYPVDGVAIDVDGDADIDIIVACSNADSITVLKNDGSAKFNVPAPVSYSAGLDPMAICAADFNGDTYIDVAVANWSLMADSIYWRGLDYDSAHGIWLDSIDVTDSVMVDSLASYNWVETHSAVSILLNDGTGAYPDSTSLKYLVGDGAISIIAVDFDSDNDTDLVVSCFYSDSIYVLINDGNAVFSDTAYYVGDRPISLAAATINGDSYVDLAVINYNSNSVVVLLNDGSGVFGTPSSAFMVGTGPYDVVADDLNNDGFVDLAVVNYYDDNVSILLGDGSGGFETAINYATGDDPRGVISADFDGDTYIDLAVSNLAVDSVSILFNRTIDE
jgi:hypothetical protein